MVSLSRKEFLRISGAAAASVVLAACQPKITETVLAATKTAEPTKTATEFPKPTEVQKEPIATLSPTNTVEAPISPIPEPTFIPTAESTLESHEYDIPTINLSGVIERLDKSLDDKVTIFMPEKLTEGDNPLIPEGKYADIVLYLDPSHDINQINLTDLFGFPLDINILSQVHTLEKNEIYQIQGTELLNHLLANWASNSDEYPQLDQKAIEILSRMYILISTQIPNSSNPNPHVLGIRIPNATIHYFYKGKQYDVNPLKRISFRVKRNPDIPLQNNVPIQTEEGSHIKLYDPDSSNSSTIANIKPFEIKPPIKLHNPDSSNSSTIA